MIKKLRIKFLVITLSMLCLLFYAMLAFFYFQTESNLRSESLAALKSYSEKNPAIVFNDKFSRFFGDTDAYSHYDIFIIEYREAGNVLTPYGFGEITAEQEEYIFSLMDEVLYSEQDAGIVKQYNLRYLKTASPGMINTVFLDKSYEDSTLSSVLVGIIVIGAVGTVLFFIITLIVTRIAIRPVERSWKQQQQLVADVSHELKTPVAVISSNLDIVISHPEESVSEQRKWLGYIKDETVHMNELIKSILYLAKTDETRADLEKNEFDLSNAVNAASLPFESVCFEKGLELVINTEPDIVFNGNKDMMMRLVSILLDNACKYSSSGNPVTVALYNAPEKIILAVNNKGELISEEHAKHIFERFYRADESRSNAHGSFGLGLSIARSIVETHGGKIEVLSSAEEGNTFVCSFKRN